MRVQKSVYHMTDRELRLYKRQLRRRMQMQRRILTMIATVCVIIFCAVSYQGIRSLASSGGRTGKVQILYSGDASLRRDLMGSVRGLY